MPTKRRAPSSPKPARPSKLAKEHKISAAQENEIREAFSLFSMPNKGSKEGIIPISDVRRAMTALDIPPTAPELAEFVSILDPDEEGFAEYEPFVAICALKMHAVAEKRTDEEQRREVDEAFRLFIKSGRDEKITFATLKGVARALKEDVSDDVLRDMILEANGGAGVGSGVERDEFEAVMRRAGIWR